MDSLLKHIFSVSIKHSYFFQEMEPYIPLWSKIPRKGSSFVIVLFLVSLNAYGVTEYESPV